MADAIRIKAYSKVNLRLTVAGIDSHGYHLLESAMVSSEPYDTVTVKKRKDGKLSVSVTKPIDGKNNALTAAERLAKKYYLGGADISIDKRIPIASGLGGSSADTAAVIYAFKRLYNIPDEDWSLYGADVPFMLCGGASFFDGRSGCFLPLGILRNSPNFGILIVKPRGKMLTKDVFKAYDDITSEKGLVPGGAEKPGGGKDVALRIDDAFLNRDKAALKLLAVNELYPAALKIDPSLERIPFELERAGAFAHVMTGSGNAFLGFFEGLAEAEAAKSVFTSARGYFEFAEICRFSSNGVEEI